MPAERVIDAIRTFARDPDPRSDGELVRQFVAARDEDAFAELLRRHGPTVFGVCRRVLGQAHDAEDAFQAVWVVFARRAGDIHPPGSVGHFLYGVAVRTATKARIMAAKRRLRDLTSQKREPASQERERLENAELAAILDDEVAKLPDKYRAAVVLCDVNGKSRSQAAAELGWPEGTVADRVRKGRELLATRLRARGVTLSLAALAGAAVPAQLAASVLASTFGGAVSSSALILAEGVMRTMTVAKWKLPLALLAVCGLTVGIGFANKPAPVDPPAPPVVVKVPAEPKPAAPVPQGGGMWKEITPIETTGWLPGSVAYSPDGKILLVGGTGGHVQALDATTRKQLWESTDGAHFAAVAYSRGITGRDDDGAEIGVTFKDGVHLLDPKTGKVNSTLTELGSAPTAVGFFRDKIHLEGGDRFTFRKVVFGNSQGYVVKTWLNNGAPGTIKTTTKQSDKYAAPLAIEPRMVIGPLAVMTGPTDPDTNRNVLWAYACGGGGKNTLLEGHKATVVCAAWSSDGTTIVTGDADGTVILWDGTTFQEKSKVGFDRRIVAVAITADGSRVAAAVIANVQLDGAGQPAYHERVHVWETKNPPKSPPALPMADDKALSGPFAGLGSLAFSPDGKSLTAAFANFDHLRKSGELRGKVRTWTLAPPPAVPPAKLSWKEGKPLELDGGPITELALDATGESLAVTQANVSGREHNWQRGTESGTTKPYGYLWYFDTRTRQNKHPNDEASNWLTHDGGDVNLDAGTRFAIAFSPTIREGTLGQKWAITHKNGVKFGMTGIGIFADPFWSSKEFDPRQIVWLRDANNIERFAVTNGHEIKVIECEFQGNSFRTGKELATYRGWKANAGRPTVLAGGPTGSHMLCSFDNPSDQLATDTDLFWVPTNRYDSQTVRKLSGHPGRPTHGAVSKNGKRIVTADNYGVVIVWNGETFKELSRTEPLSVPGHVVLGVTISPDGSTVALAMVQFPGVDSLDGPKACMELLYVAPSGDLEDRTRLFHSVRMLTGKDGKGKRPYTGTAQLLFSADGRTLYSAITDAGEPKATKQAGVRVWDVNDEPKPAEKPPEQKWQQVKILADHNAAVDAVAFTPNGKEFASIGGDGFVRLWDATTLKALDKHAMPDRGPAYLSYAPDGKAFVVASPVGVQVYDAATGKPGMGRKNKTVLAAYSPDGKWLAHTDGLEVQVIHADGNLGIIAEQTGDPKSGGPWFAAMAWAPDSKRMAIAMNDKAHSVLAWNVQNDEPSKRLIGHAEPVLVVAWSKDGKTIATGDVIGLVILWDAATGKELYRVQLGGRNGKGMVCSLAFDPASRTLAVGMLHEDGKGVERVVFLDVASGEHVGFVQTHEIGVPFSLAYSSDGKRLIVGGRPSTSGASTNSGIGVWERVEVK